MALHKLRDFYKPYKHWSIRIKLLSIVILLILSSVFLVSILSYYRYTHDIQKQSAARIQQTIEQLSLNIDTYLDDLFLLTLYPYYNEQIMTALEKKSGSGWDTLMKNRIIENYLDQLMILPRKDILSVFIMTDRIYYSGRIPRGMDADQPFRHYVWYQKALKTQDPIFVPTHKEQLVRDPQYQVFSIVKQLRSLKHTDQITGVIKVDASYRGIASIAEKINMGRKGGLFIVDENDNLIYSDMKASEAVKFFPNYANNGKTLSTEPQITNGYMINTAQIPRSNWTIVAVNSVDELNHSAQTTRNFTFLLAFLCSASAISILLIFIRSFLSPLMRIVELMKEVKKGNFQVTFPEQRFDEIGYLGSSFNEMVQEITDRIEENTNLVKQVYESDMLQKEAQLHALQSQIRPHFIYNTLNLISMQMQMDKQGKAVENIVNLSSLLRGMARWDKEVSLESEIRLLEAYLGIQKNRYEDRLDYKINLSDDLKGSYILSFLFQPIVENSIIHGCENQMDETLICLEGKVVAGNETHFFVHDNGKGMPAETLNKLKRRLEANSDQAERTEETSSPSAFGGIGLVNVNKRIKMHYGQEYGLFISSEPGKGTTVIVKLPSLNGRRELIV